MSIRADIPCMLGSLNLNCTVQYDEDFPLSLFFSFTDPKTSDEQVWEIGRDLVAAGIHSENWYGEGSVTLRQSNQWVVSMLLKSKHDGTALVNLRRKALMQFIELTYKAVPQGQEPSQVDWTEFDEERALW